jgi:hypothetical protein
METTSEEWVNNECGDFMWDDALKQLEVKLSAKTHLQRSKAQSCQSKKTY